MNDITVRLHSGVSLVVPASLDAMTTYVLLEQEDWFEKEPAFLSRWLRPGMTVIDIGANLGTYGLPLARRVGPHGMVFAYEPAGEPRALLERSRTLNRADNLRVVAAALSDQSREGAGPADDVSITSLDAEDGSRGWASIDFVKIDAQGEEERVLEGGRSFFERHSPLVMFEVKAGHASDETLRSAFRQRGYAIYRLLSGAPVLVPVEAGEALDPYEINLFAAKPDRVAALAHEGFLVPSVPDWTPDEGARERALDMLGAQAFAPHFGPVFKGDVPLDPLYRDGLAAYAAWRSPDVPWPERCGALDLACRTLVTACNAAPSLARLSTVARAACDAGQRNTGVAALAAFADLVMRGEMTISEPFWPAAARFDGILPGAGRAEWLLVSAFEQLERLRAFSSIFRRSSIDLDWLCAQPFCSAEMERRRVLQRAAAGERVEVPARLCVAADDHLNAEVWRAGLVPNTWVRAADRLAG
jgi:hypothetical protein